MRVEIHPLPMLSHIAGPCRLLRYLKDGGRGRRRDRGRLGLVVLLLLPLVLVLVLLLLLLRRLRRRHRLRLRLRLLELVPLRKLFLLYLHNTNTSSNRRRNLVSQIRPHSVIQSRINQRQWQRRIAVCIDDGAAFIISGMICMIIGRVRAGGGRVASALQ